MKKLIAGILLFIAIVSCGPKAPEPIKLNNDSCSFCKMTIVSAPFATQLITDKGRVYKFDDVSCMINYAKENDDLPKAEFFLTDYSNPAIFVPAKSAIILQGGIINGPMGGKVVGFSDKAVAQTYQSKLQAEIIDWKTLYNLK